ncbi:MAG: protein kinase [Proteobacteria bacterium]|nr:protein kinase [Pseudomonadota bacterium]
MDVQLDSEKLIGRVLGGKFRLRSRIGAGASGTVYQADQTALGRTVAVKILNPDLAKDEHLVKRFHDEATLASRLNHPNTVSVIDYGQTDDGLLYIVMEYLRGGMTLTQVIVRKSPLVDERIVDLIGQILSGLEEAHHEGVIHADLKSDNVVVEHRRGGWDLVKVVDFGIARMIGTPQSEETKGTICGTPEYMAPELIGGADPSVASDLYAVGIVLYEILAGETPFAGGSTMDVLRRQLRQEPVLPSLKCPDRDINEVLQAIALRALAKNPADRFASAIEFRTALEQALGLSRPDDEAKIHCDGCGVPSLARFKFCPECGHPLPTGQVTATLSDAGTEPYRINLTFGQLPTLLDQRSSDKLDEVDSSVSSGILPLPLIGRALIIDELVQFVSRDGSSAVLQLAGKSGSGRSRLLEEIRHRLEAIQGFAVYSTAADPTAMKTPYYPIRALVAAAMSLPQSCAYDSLSTALDSMGLKRRDLPGIAELFGHHGELWQLEPGVRRRELFASTLRVLMAAAKHKCVVLLLDDVEQYDAPSRDLLIHLAEVKPERRLRVIATNLPHFADLWPREVARINVPTFSTEELGDIVQHLHSGRQDGMPDAEALNQHTDRTPSYADHLVRFIVEGGTIEQAPPAIADLVAERIRLLPHQVLMVCQAAAVFGLSVPRNLLEAILGDRMGNDILGDALTMLKARGLFCNDEEKGRVGFRHQLVRDVIYDSTPANVRRELHAEAIQCLSTTVNDPLILGHHHEMAGHLEDAASLLMIAGDDAVHQLDDRGAMALYQRAHEAARKVMLKNDEVDQRVLFVTLAVKLAETLRKDAQLKLAHGVVEEAKGYCDGEPSLNAQLLRASAHLCIAEGRIDPATETLRRAIGLLIPVGEMELLPDFYLDLAAVYERKGDIDKAIAELIEGIDIVTLGEGENATDGPMVLWRLLLRQARMQGASNQSERALQLAESALIHARRVRSRIGSAKVQTLLASHYEKLGNLKLAEQYREAAVNEMRRLGDRRGTAELLLSGITPTRTFWRLNPAYLREARELADEVGWSEGVQRAQAELT